MLKAMRFLALPLALVFTTCSFGQEKLLSPAEFLGYELGDRFTPHRKVVEYFNHVASVIPNAEVFPYGETYEGRPLFYLAITSAENFNSLERIRTDNLKRTGLLEGNPSGDRIAILWLSYNVHGNEASSMEASMRTLYELANTGNTITQEWLKNTLVILDPCMNPDGRDRYANFYNQYGNKPPNPGIDGYEHHEPWPGGRTNHYFFDLNRDWAWATQTESQQRLKVYNEWLPHVHVDFHEQGYNNPYFFAPAAEPMHDVISDWQRDFQVLIGKNNAKYFDEQGWLYFTKEVFDLYYPSYGDTYPTYSGAIGMTYEQAGGGASGLSVTTEAGEPLSLKERILHHHTSALSTIEISSENASRLCAEFERYFKENNREPKATYKTYVIKRDNGRDNIRQLTTWMDTHAIRYGHPSSSRTVQGYSYQAQNTARVTVTPQDIVISVYQPKSRFITTVFEPSSNLSDSLTYDITAWNLMYAYNLDAWAVTEKIEVANPFGEIPLVHSHVAKKPYAYIFKYESVHDVAFLADMMQQGLNVRSAEKAFKSNGETFLPGALIITRRNNDDFLAFDDIVIALAEKHDRKIYTAKTGFVEQGMDLGSSNLNFLNMPRVAVLFGEQTNPVSAGEIWHFFEQQIHYPVTQIGSGYFNKINLESYDVLVIPEGSYTAFDEAVHEEVSGWVTNGGRLILIGNALDGFVDKKHFGLKKYNAEDEKTAAALAEKERLKQEGFARYGEAERKELSAKISGAIYKVKLDNSHPLAFGMRDTYYTLKTHGRRFAPLSKGWNVAYFSNSAKPVQGFAGFRANQALNNSLLLGVEHQGEGEIVYFVDNPLFRSFWQTGKMLFGNAVFMVGQ
jgi:hypothetical protein